MKILMRSLKDEIENSQRFSNENFQQSFKEKKTISFFVRTSM